MVQKKLCESKSDADILENIKEILMYIGEDPGRDGLLETPKRIVDSWKELFAGYKEDVHQHFKLFEYTSNNSDIVMVKDITFFSTCEHHFLPYFGKVHIAYIPNDKIIGVSKLARIVNCLSRKLTTQENLTEEIANSITTGLNPKGVAIIVNGEHTCMKSRGIKNCSSSMTTSVAKGIFKEKEYFDKFINLLKI
jgi:GTP cyclohydrolase I